MTITTTEQVILIILCVFLAVFLILSITVLIYVLKALASLRRIMKKAEEIADKAENLAGFFEKTAPSIALGRLVSNITETVFHRHSKNNAKDKE